MPADCQWYVTCGEAVHDVFAAPSLNAMATQPTAPPTPDLRHRLDDLRRNVRRVVLARLIRAGANGIVLKTDPDDVLPRAVVTVAEGGVVLPTALAGFIELLQREQLLPSIGEQRLRVLQGRARGEPNGAIARRLNVAEKTVENYTTLNNSAFAEFIRSVDLHNLSPSQSPSAAAIAKMLGIGAGDLFDPDAPDLSP